jgi:hypothetical protein
MVICLSVVVGTSTSVVASKGYGLPMVRKAQIGAANGRGGFGTSCARAGYVPPHFGECPPISTDGEADYVRKLCRLSGLLASRTEII